MLFRRSGPAALAGLACLAASASGSISPPQVTVSMKRLVDFGIIQLSSYLLDISWRVPK